MSNASSNELVSYFFLVKGPHCSSCTAKIEKALKKHPEIVSPACDIATKHLTFKASSKYDSQEICQLVTQILNDLSFEGERISEEKTPDKKFSRHWLLGVVGIGSGALLLLLSLIGVTLPLPVMIAMAAFSTGLTFLLGIEFYRHAFKSFWRSRDLNMNTLFAISTLTVLTVSVGAFFIPWLPMMFEAGLLIFGFRHLGLAIEQSVISRVASGVNIKNSVSPYVRLHGSGDYIELGKLKIGDVLLIKAGEVIPVDGICQDGEQFICDTIKTGSRSSRKTKLNEELYSGMILEKGSAPIRLMVNKLPSESYLAHYDKDINQIKKTPPIQTIAATILKYFIPAVIITSILSAVIVSFFFPPSMAIACAVGVLVSACPCTLGMIIPLAIKIGMNKAARNKVYFKNTHTIEEVGALAGKIDTIVFDLHGTLTQGKHIVNQIKVIPDSGMSEHELLQLVALMEKDSPHPVAKSICNYIHNRAIASPQIIENLNQNNHSGVTGRIDNNNYTLGNEQMMKEAGISTAGIKINLRAGDNVVFLAREQAIVGYIKLTDPVRDDARYVVDYFKKQGKDVWMCTGADAATASRYAKALGIKKVRAAQIRTSNEKKDVKYAFIEELKARGRCVAMIGDGPNDAPALRAAHLSFVIQTGDDIQHRAAQAQASAVIENGSLKAVITAFTVGKQTVTNIKQNLFLSLGYNFFAMAVTSGLLLAIGFTIHPAVGAGLMVLQSSLILLNAYRFRQQALNHLKPQARSETVMDSHQRINTHWPVKSRSAAPKSYEEEVQHYNSPASVSLGTAGKLQVDVGAAVGNLKVLNPRPGT